jgi:quinol-cytochrome oxidoreductase complex cytochrome b subunit
MAIIEIERNEAVEEKEPEPVRVRGLPFFPHFLLREVVVMCLIAGSLILLASLYPAGLLSPADPFTTPTPIYPEWYFLYVFGFLKFWTYDIGPIPAKIIGVTLPMVVWYGLLILVPFIDRNPSSDIRMRKVAVALGVIALLGVLYFTYYGIVHGE